MSAYSLCKLGAVQSALGTIHARATSLRTDLKRSFRESLQNLLTWAHNGSNLRTDEPIRQIKGMSV